MLTILRLVLFLSKKNTPGDRFRREDKQGAVLKSSGMIRVWENLERPYSKLFPDLCGQSWRQNLLKCDLEMI